MNYIVVALICASLAALTSAFLIPHIVMLAYRKKMLDRPNYRKLQRSPIPVLGGVNVFASLVITMLLSTSFYPDYVHLDTIFITTLATTLIFMVGLLDDLIDLSYRIRFAVEIIIVTCLWYSGIGIDTFVGLFGITTLPPTVSLLLSLLVGIGLINAINLMDGVDGLVSGFGILTGTCTALFFFVHDDSTAGTIALIIVGALIPFFLCNVFSLKYKLYIGSSGTMVMGLLIYLFGCRVIDTPQIYAWDQYHISWLLAVYAVPIYDTLRVMINRILNKRSPFSPDRTHLHHIFVELKYPHSMITLIELTLVLWIIILWTLLAVLSLMLNISTAWNLLLNVVLDATLVMGTYLYINHLKLYHPDTFAYHIAMGRALSRRNNTLTKFIRQSLDRPTKHRAKQKV